MKIHQMIIFFLFLFLNQAFSQLSFIVVEQKQRIIDADNISNPTLYLEIFLANSYSCSETYSQLQFSVEQDTVIHYYYGDDQVCTDASCSLNCRSLFNTTVKSKYSTTTYSISEEIEMLMGKYSITNYFQFDMADNFCATYTSSSHFLVLLENNCIPSKYPEAYNILHHDGSHTIRIENYQSQGCEVHNGDSHLILRNECQDNTPYGSLYFDSPLLSLTSNCIEINDCEQCLENGCAYTYGGLCTDDVYYYLEDAHSFSGSSYKMFCPDHIPDCSSRSSCWECNQLEQDHIVDTGDLVNSHRSNDYLAYQKNPVAFGNIKCYWSSFSCIGNRNETSGLFNSSSFGMTNSASCRDIGSEMAILGPVTFVAIGLIGTSIMMCYCCISRRKFWLNEATNQRVRVRLLLTSFYFIVSAVGGAGLIVLSQILMYRNFFFKSTTALFATFAIGTSLLGIANANIVLFCWTLSIKRKRKVKLTCPNCRHLTEPNESVCSSCNQELPEKKKEKTRLSNSPPAILHMSVEEVDEEEGDNIQQKPKRIQSTPRNEEPEVESFALTVIKPWEFASSVLKEKGWQSKSNGSYMVKEIMNDGTVLDNNIYQSLLQLWNGYFNGSRYNILKAFAVENSFLKSSFNNTFGRIENRMASHPELFHDTSSWKNDSERVWIFNQLTQKANMLAHNMSSETKVIPVIQGLRNADACWSICQNGFASLSSLDAGYYGNGMYFTTSSEYAVNYYTSEGDRIVLLSWAIVGNAFPVKEHPKSPESFLGKPIKSGFDCHFTVVNKNGMPVTSPSMVEGVTYDEIVINQETQVLPTFVLFLEKPKVSKLVPAFSVKNLNVDSTNRAEETSPSSFDITERNINDFNENDQRS